MSFSTSSPLRTRLSVAAVSLVIAGGLAACGGGAKATSSSSASTPPPSSSPAAPAVSPLTGLAASSNPILAVKIPNTPEARPQVGLGSADMVVEELVEGGLTRLATYFQSNLPSNVGPVRSMRDSDIGLALPLKATIISSGAAPNTISNIRNHGVTFLEGGAGYSRVGGRVAPYNLMVNLQALGLASKGPVAPLLPFGAAVAAPAGSVPANTVTARFSGGSSSTFAFQGGHYVNTNGFAPANDQFVADDLVIIRVRIIDAGYKDPAGNPVPETVTTGTGSGVLIHGGTATTFTWTKPGLDAPWKFTLGDGTALTVPAGHVWLALVPEDGSGGGLGLS